MCLKLDPTFVNLSAEGPMEGDKCLNPLRLPSFLAAKFSRYVNSGVIRSYDRVVEWPQFVLTDFWSSWIFRCRGSL